MSATLDGPQTAATGPLLVATSLFLSLFVVPRTPILPSGDQTYFWKDA